jgi:hypothetical protein
MCQLVKIHSSREDDVIRIALLTLKEDLAALLKLV